MTAPRFHIEPEARRRAQELANRTVSDEELRAALGVPLSPEERAQTLSLVDWFCRRYPTAADRLRYARRAYARWTRHQR